MNFDGSKVLCCVNFQFFRGALCLLESNDDEFVQFNEEESVRSYREVSQEEHLEFFSKLLKPDQSTKGLSLPNNIEIFQESV